MKRVNIHEAKTQFSSLVAEIEEGEERVIICRHGVPVADLVAHRPLRKMTKSARLGAVTLHYDPAEPLSEDEWPAPLTSNGCDNRSGVC